MNDRINIFKRVLEKLMIREPVPEEVRRFVLSNKPKSLIRTLKAKGEFSVLYNYILKVYYAFGKFGISLSIAQSKIVLGIAAIVLGISISAGAAVSYKYLKTEAEEIPEKPGLPEDTVLQQKQGEHEDQKEPEPVVREIKPVQKKKKQIPKRKTEDKEEKEISAVSPVGELEPGVETRLGMNLLTANNVEDEISSEITLSIYKKLRAKRGDDSVVYRAVDKSDKNVNRQFLGRVSRLGDSYVIRIRVVEGESGKRLFDKTVTHKGEDFDAVADRIAGEIQNQENIWQKTE